MRVRFRQPVYVQILVAMLAGTLLGYVGGKSFAFLGVFASLIITVIKALASPLLFLVIFDSIIQSDFKGKGVRRMLVIAGINGVAAMGIGLCLVNAFEPGLMLTDLVRDFISQAQGEMSKGSGLRIDKPKDWQYLIGTLVPDSILGPFVSNNIPAIIVLAIVLGLSVRRLYPSERDATARDEMAMHPPSASPAKTLLAIQNLTQTSLSILFSSFHIVLKLMPIAILGSVAKAVGAQGISVFKGLGMYVLVCIGGMLLHVLLIYQPWIALWGKRSLRKFWQEARTPMLYAFGVNSSLATLSTTLSGLEKLGVSKGAARLSACVGTNFNNDGILLYQIVAAIMLAQAFGGDISLAQQLSIAGLGLIATIGVAGVPEAGVIALTLVLSSAGMPPEVIPLLLTVDWLVARFRSVTNVLGDMTVAIAIDGPPKS